MDISIVGNNKGYGEAGASVRKRALKGFVAQSGSPHEDIDMNNYTLRQRARMLYMAAPIATSAIKTNRTNTVGLGLRLNPMVDREYLGMTAQQADQWERHVKMEFALWANRKQACDSTGMNDFYEMQQLMFTSWLMSGDVFAIRKEKDPTKMHPYSLRLQVIEADRCATPMKQSFYNLNLTEGIAENGNKIYDGVEVNSDGSVAAYHFRNTYPFQMTADKTEWVRVKAYGDLTELPNVLHVMSSERPEQYRGVTYLAQIIEPMLQIRRYTESELTAALVTSFFTAFIKTNTDPAEMPFNSTAEDEDESQEKYDPNEYSMGPGQINIMNPGEDVILADPKRPASGFDGFVKALCTQMGAALEIPRDLLMKEFNSSYSASRAALLEAWKMFRMYREWFTKDFCMPVYEIWLSEAIARGRVTAPGFFDDPLTREAWLGAKWIGPSQGQLDPVKEIQAETLAVEAGFSTREDSAIKINGSDYNSNVEKLARENEKLKNCTGAIPKVIIKEDKDEEKTDNEDYKRTGADDGTG
ncbi:MAG: phage portal protein [bacterium]|nr:phage portal protein [bacterium]